MKIKNEDYLKMSNYLDSAIDHVGVEKVRAHRALGLGKDKGLRFAFDLWALVCRFDSEALKWQCGKLYGYLNDAHIATALKHYVKTRIDI